MKTLLSRIKLKNLLSFNEEGIDMGLRNLNVLVGANGSGKSNLIEALSLLRTAPIHLASGMREMGGIATWLHKSQQETGSIPIASIEVLTGIT
ncbi:MAG: AAA family ATPase, partial [Helicobacter sp.]|nr:AAA family ATPase [Helicobacter sp.]